MKEFARTSLINEPSLVLASLLGFFSDACHIVTFTYVLSVSDCVNMLGKRRFGKVVGHVIGWIDLEERHISRLEVDEFVWPGAHRLEVIWRIAGV